MTDERHLAVLDGISSPLHDVRTRALKSLVFKLSHSIVQPEELVHEHALLVNLLEWFNYEECSHEGLVLDLLSQLSKHEHAAQTLVAVGGVEFLCQYRSHSDPSLHPLIDAITDQLLTIPQSRSVLVLPQSEPSGLSVHNLVVSPSDSSTFHTRSTNDIGPAARLLQTGESLAPSMSVPPHVTSTPSSHSHSGTCTSVGAGEGDRQQALSTKWRYEGLDPLTTPTHGDPTQIQGLAEDQEDNQCCGTFLPWVFISTSDQHIITATHKRLLADDDEVIYKACHFVRDVLFQDFPEELFLQRPNILQVLLRFVGDSSNKSGCVEGLKCCLVFTAALRRRYLLSTDPSVVPMLAQRGLQEDGDGDQPSQPQREEYETMTPETLQLLQKEQLSVEGFALSVVSACAQLVGSLVTTGMLQEEGLEEVLSRASQLLCCSQQLLELCRRDGCAPGMDSKLVRTTANTVSDTLLWCLLKWKRWYGSTGPTCSKVPHLLVHFILLLSHVLCDVLQGVVSESELVRALSDTAGNVVKDLLYLPHMVACSSPLVTRLTTLLELSDDKASQSLYKITEMQKCIEAVVEFAQMDQLSPSQQTFELLTRGVTGLSFACCSQFIEKALKFCIECYSSSEDADLKASAVNGVLVLIAHCRQCVKEEVYCTLEVLSAESEWMGRVVQVLSCREVLKEIVTFGTTSSVEKICCGAQSLSLLILEHYNEKDLTIFIGLWPYLESGAYDDELTLKTREVMETSEGESDVGFTRLERIRASLRCLFSKNVRSRVWSVSNLFTMLSVEYRESPYLTTVPDSTVHDLFSTASLVTQPSTEHAVGSRSSFQKESIVKLLEVLRSASLDLPLRVSALDQLAQILQDYSLHCFALEEGILSEVNSVIDDVAQYGKKSEKISFLPSSLAILRYLVHSQEDLRGEVSHTPRSLISIFVAALAVQDVPQALYHCVKLIMYVAFSGVAYITHPTLGRGFALPNELQDRLRFPFQVAPHQLVSDHTHPPPLEPTMYNTEPAQSMLSFTWHITAVGGVHNALPHQSTLLVASEPVLPLTDKSSTSLRTFNCQVTLQSLLHDLSVAKHHREVTEITSGIISLLCQLESFPEASPLMAPLAVWQSALNRFLTRPVSCEADVAILGCVSDLLSHLVSVGEFSEEFFQWLYDVTLKDGSPLLGMLAQGEPTPGDEQSRDILQDLVHFYTTLVSRLRSGSLFPFLRALSAVIHQTGSSNFYSLPLLESSLYCLQMVTRSRLWYSEVDAVSVYQLGAQLVADLKQILKSFTAAHGGGTLSFMGKGVTRRSLSSLLSIAQTLHHRCGGDPRDVVKLLTSDSEEGLSWVSSVLCDDDVMISSCGYSLLSVMCCCVEGMSVVLNNLTCEPFGLWGRCLEQVLISSSSLLRYWAGSVLLNMTALCSKEKKWNAFLAVQTHEGSVLTGVGVLQVMLEQYAFTSKMFSSGILTKEMETKLRALVREGECGQGSSEDTPSSNVKDNQQHIQTCYRSLLLELTSSVNPCVVDIAARLLSGWLPSLVEWISEQVLSGAVVDVALSLMKPDVVNLVCSVLRSDGICSVIGDWLSLWKSLLQLMVYLVNTQHKGLLNKMATEEVTSALWCFLSPLIKLFHTGEKGIDDVLEAAGPLMSSLYQHSHLVNKRNAIVNGTLDYWDTFKDLLLVTLDHPTSASVKHLLCLFCGLLKCTLEPSPSTSSPLQGAYQSTLKSSINGNFGGDLCSCLLSTLDKKALLDCQSTHSVVKALTLLLACSQTAKTLALRNGLIESCVVELESLCNQMNVESLSRQHSKQEPSCSSEVVASLDLLKNLMFSSEEAKTCSLECGLLSTVHRMWSWCLVDSKMQISILTLLSTLTAHCPKASSAMVNCCHGNTTLVHCVVKVCQNVLSSYVSSTRSKHPPTHLLQGLTSSFKLVGNLVLSSECRRIFKKTNFISAFSATHPKTDLSNPWRCKLVLLWLHVINNLTLFSDGQQMVANTPGCLDLMLLLWQYGEKYGIRLSSLMILRNMSFYHPLKSQLVNKALFLDMLEDTLVSEDRSQLDVLTSALRALLHNCARTRVILRKNQYLENFITSKGLVKP